MHVSIKYKKRIRIVLLAFMSWFIVHEVLIVYDGFTDEVAPADYAIVLGTTVNEDGTLSERLKARLDKSLVLYTNSLVRRIFVSGGLGIEGHYEGTKMAEYLELNGVAPSDILIDNQGNTTRLTALNFVAVSGTDVSVIAVSQFFHISRCKLAFSQVGIRDVRGAHSNHFELRDVYSSVREFLGYYKYLFFYS